MTLYYFLLFISMAISIIINSTSVRFYDKRIFTFLFISFVIFFAGFRDGVIDARDYQNHVLSYYDSLQVNLDSIYLDGFDLFFWAFANVTHEISSEYGLYIYFFVAAALPLIIQYKAITLVKGDPLLLVVFLAGAYLYLHVFIQIRAALAISLVMMAAAYSINNKKNASILVFVLAAFTHLQAFFALPLLFFDGEVRRQKLYDFSYIALIFIGFGIGKLDWIAVFGEYLALNYFSKANYLSENMDLPVFPGIVLTHAIFIFALRIINGKSPNLKYYYFLRLYSFSIPVYYLFGFSWVLPFRLMEMFSVFFIMSVASIEVRVIKKIILVSIHSFALFYFYMVERDLLLEYRTVFGLF